MPGDIDEEALSQALADLRDGGETERAAAMRSLIDLVDAEAEAAVARAEAPAPPAGDMAASARCAVTGFEARRAARRAIVNRPEVASAAIAALDDPEHEVHHWAPHLLRDTSPVVAEEPLVRHMLEHRCRPTRMMCAAAFLGWERPWSARVVEALHQAANDPDEHVAFEACLGLSECLGAGEAERDRARLVTALRALAGRPYKLMRLVACRALVRAGAADAEVAARLMDLLEDEQWTIRIETCGLLISMGAADERVVAALEALLALPEAAKHDEDAANLARALARLSVSLPEGTVAPRARTRQALLDAAREQVAARAGGQG